jgi:hypothetical protein
MEGMVAMRTVQKPVLNKGEAASHRGEWVVVRSGKVVLAAADLKTLEATPGFRSDDLIYCVPDERQVF